MLLKAEWKALHYLDSFLSVVEDNAQADGYKKCFSALCQKLRFNINKSNTIRDTRAKFLRIKINTLAIEARLPVDKLSKAKAWVKMVLQQTQIFQDELQLLLSFLSFAAKMVVPGRIFLRQLFKTLGTHHRVYYLNVSMKADLQWWNEFFPQWNGVKMLKQVKTCCQVNLWTNASGSFGMEGYYLNNNETIPSISQAFSVKMSTQL